AAMSAIRSRSGAKRKCDGHRESDVIDPEQTFCRSRGLQPFRHFWPILGAIPPEAAIEGTAMAFQQADYVLGHTSIEQQRLIRQARMLAPLTERFLRDAGICSGMRVLDIGCGM